MPTLEEYLNGVQQRQQKTALLESNIGDAANTNPDEFASMVKLSRASAVAVDAVPDYLDLAKSTELLKKTNVPELVDTHPKTSQFLSDPDKAKLASDDIDNFKATEGAFGKIGDFFNATGGVIKSGVLSANAGIVGAVRMPIDLLNDAAGVILPVRPFTPLTNALAEYQKGISKAAQAALPQMEGDIGKGVVSGGASLVRNTLNLPLLFAGPSGQRAYWAATLTPVAGEEYGKGKEKGLGTIQAVNYAATQTGIEYLTEKIPMGKLVGDLKAGSPFYKTLYNQLLTEIPGEQAATVLQDLTEWATLNPEKPFKTYLEERPSAALQTLVATTVGVGGSTVIATSLEKATTAYADKADAAQRGEKIADVIANMNKLSAANKVRTRDGETFQDWINQVSEDSPIQNVYINAETLKQSGMDKQLQEIAPEIAEQVETAAAMGRDIQIPIADYMTKIAPTPLGDAMLDDLRAEGETMTRREAREFIDNKAAELQAAADQMMQQKENDQKFIDSAKEVETNMFDQLKATGVYTSAASKNFATYVRDIYVTKAAAMGITPGELYAMIPYKITAEMPAPNVQLFSQDGKVKLETDAFKAFYGNSVFKDDQGAPVLLYHGTADDVTTFDVNHPNRKDSGWLGTGVYLTDNVDMANLYADQKARTLGPKGQNVMPLYARLENPYYATAEDKARVRAGGREAADAFTADLQAQGYDGVIYQPTSEAREVVVFDPAAVKSQFNDGTWSNENNLLAQKANLIATNTPEFKAWFDGSQVVDENGNPMIMYHGTYDDFSVAKTNFGDEEYFKFGIHVGSAEQASQRIEDLNNPGNFSRIVNKSPNIIPLYVKAKNPLRLDENRTGRWGVNDIITEIMEKAESGQLKSIPQKDLDAYFDDQFNMDKAIGQKNKDGRVWSDDFAWSDGEKTEALNKYLKKLGYDSIVYKNNFEGGGDSYILLDPNQVKSAVGNNGQFNPNNPNILNQKQKAQAIGKQVPTTLDDLANVDAAFKFAASQTFATNRDFKVALQDRVLSAAKAAKVDLGDFTEAVEQYLVRVALADAVTALETNPNAVGWYNEKVTKALRLVSLIHPEINTDPQAKFAFTWALAVTSNGLKVDKNFELAERAYAAYKETGKMPTNMQAGQAQIAINESLGMFNDLIEKYGFETVEKFMTTKQTVKQVVEFTGKNVSGENLTTEVYGAAALGPKIGNGFFANLYGHFEQLTMDRWLMRTWGRWTGTLLDDNKANIKIKQSQLKSTIQAMSAADKKAFEAIIKTKLATTKLNEVAEAIEKASMKPENRRQMAMIGALDDASRGKLDEIFGAAKKGQLRVSMGDELRKVGNSLAKYMDGQKEAPSGPPERARIRKVMAQALTNLQQQFPSLTMSDLQALLWYPEKRLYDSAKTAEEGATGYEDNEAPDYANAAAALAKEKGVSEETINQTIKDVDNELSAIAAERAAGAERNIRDSVLRQGVGPATVDQRTGLDLNPDGTVTLYHHTSEDAAGAIKRSGQLISAGEPDVYLTTRRETDTGYGDTVVTVRVNPDRLNIDDEFPNGRQDFRIDVGQPGGAVQVLIGDYRSILNQPARGGFDPKSLTTILTKESDYSTFIHETTHFYLDMLTQLADMPNAPQEFKNDLAAILEWAGATPQEWAAWNQEFKDTGKMNEGMRKVHEAFAYNSEIYIATGNAPSLKMQTMFDQFAAWLRRVYKSIREELNVVYRQEHGEDLPILTGEVRQVMDRMLASEEQIIQAQTVRGMSPFYQTQEASGMDDATWAAYQAMSKEAQDQSVSDLTAASLRQMRWLSNAKSRIFKEMQKQNAEIRKDVRAQVAKEIEQQPIYRALRLIKFGEEIAPDGTTVKMEQNTKLSVSAMQDLYMGEGDKYALLDWSSLGYGKYGMLSEDGMHPDALAERVGFSSGDELVRSLLNAKTLKEAVEEKTDQRMLEEYGDLSDQRSMDLAVERALHNEARARFVAAELRHAAKATQPVRVMLAAARQAARRIVGNKLVRDTKVSEYSAAETRATRAAEKAMKEGKPEEVTKQLQNRLLNNQLTAEATKATQEVDKGLRYLKSMQTDQSRKRVGADYSDQVDQLLARFDLNNRSLKSIDAQTSLMEWMKSQEDAGYQPEISLSFQNEGYRKNYKNMTVDEFRDLVDAIKQIEHMGKTEQNMLTAAKETAYKQARDEIVASIDANANGRVANTRTPTTEMGRRIQGLKRFWAAHIKAATVSQILDGGKEGPMWEYFIRSANKRGDQETVMRAKATEHLTEIFAPIFKLGKMGGTGIAFPTINRSLNREARMAIGLNMGNEGNMQRLLDGEGWTREQIQPVLDSLTSEEWLAIQKVWDYFESYRPAIAEKERRIYGKEPKWIEPKALTINLANGQTMELRGGYYPIKYDPMASVQAESNDEKEAAKRQLQGAFTSATTRRSFTKTRVEKVEGRPLIYTLAGMYSGINDVIHDLAWHEWLIDANKLLRSQSIDQAIRTQYGPEFKQQLKTWVEDVAAGERGVQNEAEIGLNYLRQSVSAAGLGFNVMSALQQITGFNQSIIKVGVGYIGRGIAKTIGNPRNAMKEVNEKSSFMANRSRTQFRELNELRNMVQDETAAMRQVKLGAYFMMMRMQRMVDVPTWFGAYEKAIGQGHDEEKSVALADQAVIDSQGGGMVKDLSRVERGGAGLKLFTVYYSYMNTVFNLAVLKGMTEKSKAKLAVDYAMLFVVPVVLTTALKSALTPGGDDKWDWEKIAKKLAAEELSYLMGTMVIVREFAQAGTIMFGAEKARDYSGPAGVRAVADSITFLKQASQGEFDTSFRKAAINLIGDFTGLPSAQVNRTINGTTALVEGKTENPAAVVLGYEKK